jgi:hypothetical protein
MKGLLIELCDLYRLFRNDLCRILLLAGIGLLLLEPDKPTISLVTYSFGLSFLLVAASHIARKILFRRIDIAAYAEDAKDTRNVGSAIVFLAVCLVLIALMYIMAAPLLR